MNVITHTMLLGVGATMVTDLWGLARKPLLGIAAPDYRLVGRWFGYMTKGQFRHEAIAKADRVPGEHVIGWMAHYLTGIAFAAVLVAIAGRTWLQQPTIGLPMAVGICSVLLPSLLMQPAMGAGIASRRTARPGRARLQTLLLHAVFGMGLYLAGLMLNLGMDNVEGTDYI
jgi:hypothetical protein